MERSRAFYYFVAVATFALVEPCPEARAGSTIQCQGDRLGRPDYSWRRGKSDGSDAMCAPGYMMYRADEESIAGCTSLATIADGTNAETYSTPDWETRPKCADGYEMVIIEDPEPAPRKPRFSMAAKKKTRRR